jgi:hypothetical protein
MGVAYPGRRQDVVTALGLLAAEVPELDGAGWDSTRWPDLTAAVHWLVDDTAWDVHDPAGSIGVILHDEGEADAVRAVVNAVIAVSDRQGAAAPDASWYGDQTWPDVRQLAENALASLTR